MIPRKKLQFKRVMKGEYVNGVWVEGKTIELWINASVQPTTAKQMQALPEGRRNKQSFTLIASIPLRTAEQNGNQADLVAINGSDYEVVAVEHWNNGILPHFKIVVSGVA